MRGIVVPITLAAFLGTALLAIASETASGVVRQVDKIGHTLTLEDGSVYTLPMVFRDPGLKAGARVVVTWAMKDGKRHADAVRIED